MIDNEKNDELEVKIGMVVLTFTLIGIGYTGYLAYKGINILLSYI